MRAHTPSLVIATALCWLIASLGTTPQASAVEEADASAEVEEEAPSGDADAQDEAEDAAGEDPQAPAETELAQDERIEQLFVTATKREESIQDVPISMAALDSSFLESSGVTQFLQLQQFVPNLSMNPATTTRRTTIRIRGIGSVGGNAGIDPSVGVFIDGVYQGRAGMSVADLLDIERVEVLRGPQGTLYGKNTAAGLLNIVSKRPSYEPEATLEGVFGNYANYEGRGMVNYPLVDEHIATRASAYWVTRDGFDINTFDGSRVNDDNRWGIKSSTAFDVTDSLSFTLRGDYSFQDNKCCVADISSNTGAPTLNDGFLKASVIEPPFNIAPAPGDPYPNYPDPTTYPTENWLEDPRGTYGGDPTGAVPGSIWQRGQRTTFQQLATNRAVAALDPADFPDYDAYADTVKQMLNDFVPLPEPDPFDRRVSANENIRNEVTIGGVTFDASYDIDSFADIPFLDGANLSFIGAWRHYESNTEWDGDFSFYDAILTLTETQLDQYSAELRLASPGGELFDYQVGLYFYHQTQDTVEDMGTEEEWWPTWNLMLNSAVNTGDNTHETFSYAAFGQFDLNPVEWFKATGGLRVTTEKKTRVGTQLSEYFHFANNVPPGNFLADINVCGLEWFDGSPNPYMAWCRDAPPILGPPISVGVALDPQPVADANGNPLSFPGQSRQVANVSWKANVRFYPPVPTGDLMLYASAATGFKSGGFNQLRTQATIPGEFDDEKSLSIEGGFKSTWFDGMLTLNATGFWTEYKDFQAQVFNGASINVINAATLESYGVEADLLLAPFEYLTIGGAMGFNIAEYGEFEDGLATAWQTWENTRNHKGGVMACGLEASDNFFGDPIPGWETKSGEWAETCVQDLTGKTLESAPRWNVSLWLQSHYLLPWWPLESYLGSSEVFLRAEYAYTSSQYLDSDLDPNLFQPGTHIVNLRAGVRADNGRWELTGWVRNLTDEKYNVDGFDVPTLNGFAVVNGPPRQWGLTLRVNFGALVN